jgi:hypothetical protein
MGLAESRPTRAIAASLFPLTTAGRLRAPGAPRSLLEAAAAALLACVGEEPAPPASLLGAVPGMVSIVE